VKGVARSVLGLGVGLALSSCAVREPAREPVPAASPEAAPSGAATAREVVFPASDGAPVWGDLHLAQGDAEAPVLLLFHQGGGDARGEYAPIVPRLVSEGYHVLAADLREGGELFGGGNRTLAARDGIGSGYCAAYPDLEGALRFVREQGLHGPCVAWGSSFSGALVLRLARDHADELAGVIAFSPASGEPMQGCPSTDFAADVRIPALCVRPASEAARETVRAQLEQFEALGLETWVADPGVHGSSSLVAERAGGDVEPSWRVTLEFLARACDLDDRPRE